MIYSLSRYQHILPPKTYKVKMKENHGNMKLYTKEQKKTKLLTFNI
jgi:hypothetical protein